ERVHAMDLRAGRPGGNAPRQARARPGRPAQPRQDLPRPRAGAQAGGPRRLLRRSAVVVDGLAPRRVERPATAEALAEALRTAADAGEAVVPVGGGRALGLGDVPERVDVVLETRGLSRVLERSPADLTVSVEAGVTVEELKDELAAVGQFLPLDPFNAPGHTIGGVLAAGLSGPLRLRYGSPRAVVSGLRAALPD